MCTVTKYEVHWDTTISMGLALGGTTMALYTVINTRTSETVLLDGAQQRTSSYRVLA